jgi:2,4-dienoyl-CoA reductase-like NADH-dependent reductase (Old Yellow Enzyme family)
LAGVEVPMMLLEPITLRDLTIRNRVWMAPMCQYSAAPDGPLTGAPTDWHLAHLGSRAAGGVGLVIAEATAVSPGGRISPQDTGLWNAAQQDAWARITRLIQDQGAAAGIQLAHAGRKASTYSPWRGQGTVPGDEGGWPTVGPSPVAFGPYARPQELDVAGINEIVGEFAAAARRALAAGFQVVEVHGAHGYLLHEFLSPYSNRRTDAYGGPFDNRIRLALEVVEAVRAQWPAHLPVLFRVSATDWLPDATEETGWTLEQTVRLAKELAARGVDLVDTSTGGNVESADIPVGPGFQAPFAAAIRNQAGVPTGAVGMITQPVQAEQILADGQADVVLLGRQLLREPHWVWRAATESGGQAPVPPQYLRAR